MNILTIQKLFLLVLICVMFTPYVASFSGLRESSLYEAEIVALASWYIASLAIPLIMKDLDTIFVLWCPTFILVGVAVGSDMVYQITRNRQVWPAYWYNSSAFYLFMETWILLVMPGCVLFFVMLFSRRAYLKSKDIT